jgi:hypothetical protein
MKQWKFWETDACPCCGTANETARHVVLCPDDRMKQVFTNSIATFTDLLERLDTHPDIQQCLVNTLATRDATTAFRASASTAITAAAAAQDRIGWLNLTEGRLSLRWQESQEEHLRASHSRKTGQTWAAEVVSGILRVTHSLWLERNRILHEKDAQGLLLKHGQDLRDKINETFDTPTEDLLPGDRHLKQRRSLAQLHRMLPMAKATWLHAMDLAISIAQGTRQSDAQGMRSVMEQWLGAGEPLPLPPPEPPPGQP